MRTRLHGFSLIELLLSGAILVTLLLVLGQLFAGTRQAYQVSEDVSEHRQTIQAAVELMRYEMTLAGYRCSDASSMSRVFLDPPFEVEEDPTRITVRYFEDRYVEADCVLIEAEFTAAGGDLLRTVDGEATSLVAGVEAVAIVSWLNRANSLFVDPQRPPDEHLAGVILRVAMTNGPDEVITIGFKNPQCETASECG